jgi:hypothetical protein
MNEMIKPPTNIDEAIDKLVENRENISGLFIATFNDQGNLSIVQCNLSLTGALLLKYMVDKLADYLFTNFQNDGKKGN